MDVYNIAVNDLSVGMFRYINVAGAVQVHPLAQVISGSGRIPADGPLKAQAIICRFVFVVPNQHAVFEIECRVTVFIVDVGDFLFAVRLIVTLASDA